MVVVPHCALPWSLMMLSTFHAFIGHVSDLFCELDLLSRVALSPEKGSRGTMWRTVEGPWHGSYSSNLQGTDREGATDVVWGSPAGRRHRLPRWPGRGFTVCVRNFLTVKKCTKILWADSGAGGEGYNRHVSRDNTVPDEAFQRRLRSRLMVVVGGVERWDLRLDSIMKDARGHWVGRMGTQRPAIFTRLVFLACLLLFSPADLILLVIQESTCWKSRETKHSVWLCLFLQLLRAPSQDTVGFKGLHVSQNWPMVWIRKATCVCVHAPGCISFCVSWGHQCLSHRTNHCKQQGSRKGLWHHLPTIVGLQTMS